MLSWKCECYGFAIVEDFQGPLSTKLNHFQVDSRPQHFNVLREYFELDKVHFWNEKSTDTNLAIHSNEEKG